MQVRVPPFGVLQPSRSGLRNYAELDIERYVAPSRPEAERLPISSFLLNATKAIAIKASSRSSAMPAYVHSLRSSRIILRESRPASCVLLPVSCILRRATPLPACRVFLSSNHSQHYRRPRSHVPRPVSRFVYRTRHARRRDHGVHAQFERRRQRPQGPLKQVQAEYRRRGFIAHPAAVG